MNTVWVLELERNPGWLLAVKEDWVTYTQNAEEAVQFSRRMDADWTLRVGLRGIPLRAKEVSR